MDTKLVKQYIIILLVLLNIVLFITNIAEDSKYVITREEKLLLVNHLENNNIFLSTDIIETYMPLPKISMKKTIYEQNDIIEIFFKEELNQDISNLIDLTSSQDNNFNNNFNNNLIEYNNKLLSITNNNLYFKDLNIINNFEYTITNCIKEANYYAEELGKKYGNLSQDIVLQKDNYILISYSNELNNFKNFSNALCVKIYSDGSKELYFTDYDKAKLTTQNIGIYSIFEVMYIFGKEIPNLIQDENIYIEDISIGYYIKDKGENIYLSFEPCYRIIISNSDIPFFINAYTNTFEYDVNFII